MLGKPQLPRPPSVTKGSDWQSIWTAFGQVHKGLQALIQYLQKYLTDVYNQIIPANFIVAIPITPALSPYTINATDGFVGAFASPTAPTIVVFPVASGSGRIIVVKKLDANAQNITILPTPGSGDLFDGAASLNLTIQYDAVPLIDYALHTWLTW